MFFGTRLIPAGQGHTTRTGFYFVNGFQKHLVSLFFTQNKNNNKKKVLLLLSFFLFLI